MHDLLFDNQYAFEDQSLIGYAQSLDLNIDQFIKDMNSQETARKINEDFLSGVKSGVNGTPTFFINGVRFNGPTELKALREAIEAAMK
jgi:protein-disulfide isomerase